jgi:hypothetical protein
MASSRRRAASWSSRTRASTSSRPARKSHDLTLVASGKGEISKLFERDAHKSPTTSRSARLALTYVKGMRPREPFSRVCFNLIPGVGEYFVFPR